MGPNASNKLIEMREAQLEDAERAKILGLNSARIFKLPIPARYLDQPDTAAVAREVGVFK